MQGFQQHGLGVVPRRQGLGFKDQGLQSVRGANLKALTASLLPWELKVFCPPEVDRLWGIWGSYYNIPKAIFYLLKGTIGSRVERESWESGKPGAHP